MAAAVLVAATARATEPERRAVADPLEAATTSEALRALVRTAEPRLSGRAAAKLQRLTGENLASEFIGSLVVRYRTPIAIVLTDDPDIQRLLGMEEIGFAELLTEYRAATEPGLLTELHWFAATVAGADAGRVERLVGELGAKASSADLSRRRLALEQLGGHTESAAARKVLIGALKDRDADTVQTAVAALRRADPAQYTPPLLALMTDHSRGTSHLAIDALVTLRRPEVEARLLAELPRAPAAFRRRLVDLLGDYGSELAVRALETARTDSDGEVAFFASRSLGALRARLKKQ